MTVRTLAATRLATLLCALACAPARPLDLSQSYQAALASDPAFLAVRADTDARRERLPQAQARGLPNLAFSLSRQHNVLASTVPTVLGSAASRNTDYVSGSQTLTLRQPLFNRYQAADLAQAQAQVDQAEATLDRELQQVAVRVSGAYFEALLSADQLALVLAQKVAVTAQLAAARKRFDAGIGTRTDIDEAQAVLDLNLAQELEAHQNLAYTRRELQTLVNRPVDTLATLDASRMALAPPTPDRLSDWTERAEAGSPEVRALLAQREAASLEVRKAEAGHYPTLDAVAQLSRTESESVTSIHNRYSNRSIGLQLNVPIYAGGAVRSAERQAQAELARADHALKAMRRDLGQRVYREFRGVTEGVLKVRALEQAVRSSGQLVLSNRRSWEAGSRTQVDVLQAEQQLVSARRDLALARYTYLMSRVCLQALAGGPAAEVVDEINRWLQPPAANGQGGSGAGH